MRYGSDYDRGGGRVSRGGYHEAYGPRGGGPGPRTRGRAPYGYDYDHRARPPAGYGYRFRRGYEVQGGFGYANERARREEIPAWTGPLRVGRRFGQGYGRG